MNPDYMLASGIVWRKSADPEAGLELVPGWDGIHPLLIHFPLTLFFLAPVFVLFASLAKTTTRRTFLISALTVMLLGIASTYAAFEAGPDRRCHCDSNRRSTDSCRTAPGTRESRPQ